MTRIDSPPCRVDELTGPFVLESLGEQLDVLAAQLDVPLTSGRTWFAAWVASYPDFEPWVFVARRGPDLLGACLMARRRIGRHVEVVALGHGRNDRTRMLAVDDDVAAHLADRLVIGLHGLRDAWTLSVEQLPPGDPTATAINARLPGSHLIPGGSVPGVDFGERTHVEPYLTKNLRRQLQKCRNRLVADGVTPNIAFTRDPRDIAELLGEIEDIHRTRDLDVGRASDTDAGGELRLWRHVIDAHVVRGQVEVATLHLDHTLAAYVVSFLDGDTYRVFDGRFRTRWERYSPGRLLETETLGHAMNDRAVHRLDWMNSIAPDKLVCANTAEATVKLVGSSLGEAAAISARSIVARSAQHQVSVAIST